MAKSFYHFWLISIIFILTTVTIVNTNQPKCQGQDPQLQCILFKQYPQLDDEIACQLCAVAIQSGKYPLKIQQFCNVNKQTPRSCGLITFTYLLTSYNFIEAFKYEYQIFYRDPFNHDQRVTAILNKQNIRSKFINWSEKQAQNKQKQTYLKKAIVNLYLDDPTQSLNNLEFYLSLNGGVMNKDTIKLKCRIYQKIGQFNQALNILSNYIKQAQKDQKKYDMLQPYLYHLKGNLLMHHLKFDLAILQFTKASSMFKSYYNQVHFFKGFKFSNYNIGLCYQKLSKHDQAIKRYTQLVKNGVKNAQVLNALGNSYIEQAQKQNTKGLDQKKLKKAIFYFLRAIDDNNQYYVAHYNLGYAYLKSNQLQKAIQKFKDSLKIKRTSQAQYGLLTSYFLSQKYQQAKAFIQSMGINDQNIDDLLSVYYEYGTSNKKTDFYDKVISQYQDRIKSANGHYWKAMIQFQMENYGLAIDHFLSAYDKGYSEPHLLFNLAYSYQLLKDYTNALSYYQKAYKKDPRSQTKAKIQQCKNMLAKNQRNKQL